ncbi:MAG: hypothetical protein HDR01_12455 [Lachnospiraceae bacterium]|nr:hypothetical protein [Lachnospiraceae bacterium]
MEDVGAGISSGSLPGTLSRDDEMQGESNSIKNQKEYLEDFARKVGFRNIRHFNK